MTFKPSFFNSVRKAHKEYRQMRRSPDRNAVTLYLQNYCMDASVKGMYSRWIVLQSILKGNDIFGFITEDDFI